MKHSIIYNEPDARANITYPWCYWDNAFTDEELERVKTYCEQFDLQLATTLGNTNPEEIEKIRKSKINFIHKNPDSAWIFEKVNGLLHNINEQFYGFHLNGYQFLQYTTYDAEVAGNYTWHMDMCLDSALNYGQTRKLSMTLLLNDDYEGGEFEFNTGQEAYPMKPELKKGRAIVFPSFVIHRVKPVTKGKRISLVAWVLGPKFE